jgi:16S rRNA (guanine966-N2)-methyltransferase
MRIVGGTLRGRRLAAQKTALLRPTTDRVREAMFSTLDSMCSLAGATVIDMYAGTGALGIEALSRGADFACFVEQNQRLAASLEKLLVQFGLFERSAIICGDVRKVLADIGAGTATCFASVIPKEYDLLFADPPYDRHPARQLTEWLFLSRIVKRGSVFVVEAEAPFGKEEMLPAENCKQVGLSLRFLKSKSYGRTVVSYFIIDN